MRKLIDILNEVTLAKYDFGKKFLISDSQAGKKLKSVLQSQGFNTEVPIELIHPTLVASDQAAAHTELGTGSSYFAFKNSLGQTWIATGSLSQIQSPLVHYKGDEGTGKLANRGEIAEGILGAAMFAKFIKRESKEEIGVISAQDVSNVLDQLKLVEKDAYQVTVNDTDNQHADTVTFLLRLKTAPYKDLMDSTKRELLAPEFSSAVGYVNSAMADRYSKYFYLNGRADEIAIIADGAASESERKTDVWVAVKDEHGQMRRLKLNTSLKVGGIAQFGQVGGSELESMIKLWEYFGINIDQWANTYQQKNKKDQLVALEYLYRNIAKHLAGQLKGNNTDGEAKFVDNIAHAVTFFATLGDQNVELVDFDRGGFKILRFRNLKNKLRTVDLTASYVEHKTRPEISIHDVLDPKKELLSIRVKVEQRPSGMYIRNIIEKGPLLEDITKVQQQAQKEIETPDVTKIRTDIRPPAAERAKREPTAKGLGRERR